MYRLYGNNLPDLRLQFIRGQGNGRNPLSKQEDAIQNIKGEFHQPHGYATTSDNLFKTIKHGWDGRQGHSDWGHQLAKIDFDAQRVVRTADETRPKNIAFRYICFAG